MAVVATMTASKAAAQKVTVITDKDEQRRVGDDLPMHTGKLVSKCSEVTDDGMWRCTRIANHSGDHVGHFPDGLAGAQWPKAPGFVRQAVRSVPAAYGEVLGTLVHEPRDADQCGEEVEFDGDDWTCTRRMGHEGDHVACYDDDGHTVAAVEWDNEEG